MKKYLLLTFFLFTIISAETKLGATYIVIRKGSPYVAELGDKTIRTLPEGTKVRLIKNETMLETALLFPFRVLKLMVAIEPRGNWLVEDEHGNRGYMWDSDLELVKK